MMMSKLREYSKIFIYIVALSFVGLMVFEWGMNYTGKSGRNDVVGEVNGKKLSYGQFSELYQQLYENYKTQTGQSDFTEDELQRLRNQVWENFVQRTLFQEELDRLNIGVTDSEIVYNIYNHPTEQFKRIPQFQTNGVFDIKKYRASFSDPNIPWNWAQIEDMYRQQIPYLKLQNIITNTVRVSDEEIEDEYIKKNIKAKVEYLGVLAARFNNPQSEVSDAQIEAYYNTHKEDYKQNEMRELSYVVFPIKTNKKDTLNTLDEFKYLRERIAQGDKFEDLAAIYSTDPSAKKNKGDLGYFDRKSMVKPFADAAFAADTGQIVGPVKTRYGFHLIYVKDKKVENGVEKVKASHILLKVTPAPSTIEEADNKARFFAEDAKEIGFQAVAEKNNMEIKNTGLFEERAGFIPGIGQNHAVMNFAFSKELNDVSNIIKLNDQSYAVFTISKIQQAGYKNIDEVKHLIANSVRMEIAKGKAKDFTISYVEPQVKSGKTFKIIADQDTSKKTKYGETGLFSLNSPVQGIPKSPQFNATAFTLEIGEISDMIETSSGYYYEKLLEKTKFDSSAYKTQMQVIKNQLLRKKQNRIFNDWYDQLKKNADIVDNRKMFGL
jgi:parvulin-like peptidyl-prolyl isomerase